MRALKNRFLDTACAATHLGYHLTTEEQIAADQAVAQRFNLDAERLGWRVRLRLAHRALELVGLPTMICKADAAARHAGRFEELRPGAINEAARLAFESKPRSWVGETLLRLLWASMQDAAEFRAGTAEEYRRVRKNVVGDDIRELTDQRDFLDREFTCDRSRWHGPWKSQGTPETQASWVRAQSSGTARLESRYFHWNGHHPVQDWRVIVPQSAIFQRS